MRLLLDTHLWLWFVEDSPRLSPRARAMFADSGNTLVWSVVTIWEIAIKQALQRADFLAEPITVLHHLRRGPFEELPLLAEHTLPVGQLPPHHQDPFDRILIAQAIVEGIILVTSDRRLPAYGDVIRRV